MTIPAGRPDQYIFSPAHTEPYLLRPALCFPRPDNQTPSLGLFHAAAAVPAGPRPALENTQNNRGQVQCSKDGCNDAIGNDPVAVIARKLDAQAAVDHAQDDEGAAVPDVRVADYASPLVLDVVLVMEPA